MDTSNRKHADLQNYYVVALMCVWNDIHAAGHTEQMKLWDIIIRKIIL